MAARRVHVPRGRAGAGGSRADSGRWASSCTRCGLGGAFCGGELLDLIIAIAPTSRSRPTTHDRPCRRRSMHRIRSGKRPAEARERRGVIAELEPAGATSSDLFGGTRRDGLLPCVCGGGRGVLFVKRGHGRRRSQSRGGPAATPEPRGAHRARSARRAGACWSETPTSPNPARPAIASSMQPPRHASR